MSRSLAILIAILLILALGAGAFYWFNRDSLTDGIASLTNKNTNQANTNTSTTTNTNTVVTTAQEALKGDKVVSDSATIDGVKVAFSSATKTDTFLGVEADSGKDFVIAFFDPVKGNDLQKISSTLENQTRLVTDKGTITLGGLKIANDVTVNDRGYLKFIVPEGAKRFTVEIGSGAATERIALPL